MSKDREFPGICCMRSDCPDEHCPGRQIARLYCADEGGRQVDTDRGVRRLIPPPPRLSRIAFGLRLLAPVLVLVAAYAAAALFLTFH